MSQTLANIAVIAATIGTVTFLLPQIIKLVRSGESVGVSPTWPALGFVTNVGWFAYMISQGHWAAILAPIVTFLSYVVTLWALGRTGRDLRAGYFRGVAWAGFLAAIAALGGWVALGVLLGLSYGVMVTPSLWTAYRTPDPSGISPGTWWIGIIEGLLWGYFGWFHADVGIVTFSIVAVIGAVLMLARYYGTRRLAEVVA